MQFSHLNLKEMNLDDISPSTYNPRKRLKPGDSAYERLKASILHYGYVDPLIYNERTNTLIGGHQRLQVLKDLGVERVQVSIVSLDEASEKDLNVRLNQVQGEFEPDALAKLLHELVEDYQTNLDDLGFSQEEYDDLLNELSLADPLDYEMRTEPPDVVPIKTNATAVSEKRRIETIPDEPNFSDNGSRSMERTADSPIAYAQALEDEPITEEAEAEEERYPISFYFTYEDRQLIHDALQHCLRSNAYSSTEDALLHIIRAYQEKENEQ